MRMPVQETLALQCADVLHNRRLAGEAKMSLDFARARGDSSLPLLTLNKIEDSFLALGQHDLESSKPICLQVQMNIYVMSGVSRLSGRGETKVGDLSFYLQ